MRAFVISGLRIEMQSFVGIVQSARAHYFASLEIPDLGSARDGLVDLEMVLSCSSGSCICFASSNILDLRSALISWCVLDLETSTGAPKYQLQPQSMVMFFFTTFDSTFYVQGINFYPEKLDRHQWMRAGNLMSISQSSLAVLNKP